MTWKSIFKIEFNCPRKFQWQAQYKLYSKEYSFLFWKEFFKAQLHDGEVEVMILAKEICANLVVIDDKNAKKHAKYLGINVIGTLGILLKAKQEGFIQEIKPLLLELRDKGIYIGDNIINICLKATNEK